ncbi:hypothetical protein [Pseudoflavonifractor capillosus]|uniref:Uncharacterized protein n=1 Tax=Pseudoflavonifractor capillosus TaxID=106588 RepID=A0A921MMP2_9FIRM|nr:hypothetical protein [Pseudoflavonifractor capillosus]HJG87072.1 hypothetical protein [Pseudoflavonifractor capillosus]
MYAQTTFLAASGLGVGITAGARPEGRTLARAGACSAALRRNIDLGALRKFPAAQRSARRGPVPAARAGRTAA